MTTIFIIMGIAIAVIAASGIVAGRWVSGKENRTRQVAKTPENKKSNFHNHRTFNKTIR